MKKSILFYLIVFLVSSSMFSQETIENTSTKNFNEFKLNGLYLILGVFEASYETTLNDESAVGISVLLPIDNAVNSDIKYAISPYYRFYFGEKYAAGFFVEGFGMLNSTNRNIDLFEDNEDDFRTDFALGFAVGGKWVTKKGFSIEIFGGIGRNLFNNEGTDYDIVGKGGVNLGYRF
ncbi:DUF3575 domain-containing protein [Mariniflexile sp.]|uniref:DUF3575 domain-containing protein n=1 Tax=Mariniflexile sp. TaxID=1979402 RepID=UPI00404846D8